MIVQLVLHNQVNLCLEVTCAHFIASGSEHHGLPMLHLAANLMQTTVNVPGPAATNGDGCSACLAQTTMERILVCQ